MSSIFGEWSGFSLMKLIRLGTVIGEVVDAALPISSEYIEDGQLQAIPLIGICSENVISINNFANSCMYIHERTLREPFA